MNTTKPEDLEESTFTKYDVKAGRSIGVDNNVSVAWGIYNRAPPEEVGTFIENRLLIKGTKWNTKL